MTVATNGPAPTTDLDDDGPDPFRRDHYGRPLITDPDTGKTQPYTRISTFSGLLHPKYLATYHQWWAMRAAHLFPVEAQAIATAPSQQKGQQGAINNLLTWAGMNEKRDRGSARHTRVRQALTNSPMPELTDRQRTELYKVADTVRSLGRITGVEVPLVCDTWKVAGSADYVGTTPAGRPFIADLKTGDGKYGNATDIEWALQLIGYARSRRWDPVTCERGGYVCETLPRLFIIHAPQGSPGTVDIYEYDPALALQLGEVAASILAARDIRPLLKDAA